MKKGFTLVELLAVIVLLSTLMLLVTYSIINVVKDTNQTLDDSTKTVLYSAADKYLQDNVTLSSTATYTVTVGDMIKSDVISSTFLEAQDQKKISETSCVKVTYDHGNASYEFLYNCN